MLNYISAELYKVRRRKSTWALLADFDWDKVPREDVRIPEGLF